MSALQDARAASRRVRLAAWALLGHRPGARSGLEAAPPQAATGQPTGPSSALSEGLQLHRTAASDTVAPPSPNLGTAAPTRPQPGSILRWSTRAPTAPDAAVPRAPPRFTPGLAAFALGAAIRSGSAFAALPLPDWREEAIVAVWETLDDRITEACTWPPASPPGLGQPTACDASRLEAAIAWGRQALRDVSDDGRLHYLIGLALRHLRQNGAAEAELRTAVRLRPAQPGAWADLGDLLVQRQAWTEAAEAFREVIRLHPEGTAAWYGWLQIAQIAGWQHDPQTFEYATLESIRLGFLLVNVADNDAWKGFWRDPALRESVERLVCTYAPPGVLESLRAP